MPVPKGFKHSKETKEKIRKFQIGRIHSPFTDEVKKRISNSLKELGMSEEKSPNWKGDNVGYVGLHIWVKKWKGRANHCEMCGLDDENRIYNWANVDHKYRRVLEDYIPMCIPCHKKWDKDNENPVIRNHQ